MEINSLLVGLCGDLFHNGASSRALVQGQCVLAFILGYVLRYPEAGDESLSELPKEAEWKSLICIPHRC